MNVLIDTNIALSILFNSKKLNSKEKNIIQNIENQIIINSITIFEISLKYSLNKLELRNILPHEIPDLLVHNGYIIENIDFNTFATFYKLPFLNDHKDPFDRLIIWEAICKGYYLLSKDKQFKYYKDYGLKLL